MEGEFDDIKQFIWEGGKAKRFVTQLLDRQFVTNFTRGMAPTKWMHILSFERGGGWITAYAQFFAGPRALPPPYQIRVGRDPSSIVHRPERVAHQYVILEASPKGPPTGIMEDAKPVNHLCIPGLR